MIGSHSFHSFFMQQLVSYRPQPFTRRECPIFEEIQMKPFQSGFELCSFTHRYKSVAQYLMDLQKQYPSQGGYYSQYVNMILEEAEAVRDNRKSANIFTPSTNSFSPSAPQQLQFQPIEQPSTPTSSFTPQPSSSLSYDDFRMAAVGLGQKVHQFDQITV